MRVLREQPIRWLSALGVMAGCVLSPGFSEPTATLPYTASDLYAVTRETPLVQACQYLAKSPEGRHSLDLLISHHVHVVFKDLEKWDKRLRGYDALSYLTNRGALIIYINSRHREAPPEALAALIAHESLHNDAHNSVQEEVDGWTREAEVWMGLKRLEPVLGTIPPATHPLVDRLNTLESKLKQGQLTAFVKIQPGYRGLPAFSPGHDAPAFVPVAYQDAGLTETPATWQPGRKPAPDRQASNSPNALFTP
ncbi:MAG: hypothetical protein AB7J37_06035 [Candidatus Melainabacteria bacterium]